MVRLGVNIDHVATIRQARKGREPDPVWAAVAAELGGADGITVHMREDRRHIQDRDLPLLKQTVQTRLNLEAALAPEIVAIALKLRPDQVTFVPEKREEITTEGGLDVLSQKSRIADVVAACKDAGIFVSLFIDPDPRQVEATREVGAQAVELHTGRYADAARGEPRRRELQALIEAGAATISAGLHLHAGHGLNRENVEDVARIVGMEELNIGHSLIAQAVFCGLERAVREMKEQLRSIQVKEGPRFS